MDSNNWREERRARREQWREERRKFRDEIHRRYDDTRGSGHIWTGLLLLLIGVAALLKAMLFPIPSWVYTWPMLLIIIGVFIGIRHNFRGGVWFILMVIGGIFLTEYIYPDFTVRKYLWPVALIAIGLFFMLRSRRKDWRLKGHIGVLIPDTPTNKTNMENNESSLPEDVVDSTSIFGGTKRNVLSKNFKGGDIVNIMGGSEIDLSQADIQGTARLELTQVFGGTKLIVPSNWQVKTQMAAIFGGVEDKRSVQPGAPDPNKVLILEGTSIFGGIDIRSY